MLNGFKYALRRHTVAVVLVFLALVALFITSDDVQLLNDIRLALLGALQVGVGVITILLVTKFAFPKLRIQETIKDEPVAVALFAGCIAIAISILF